MADTQSVVEILMKVRTEGQSEISALQKQFGSTADELAASAARINSDIKAEFEKGFGGAQAAVNDHAAAMAAWRKEAGLSSQATIDHTRGFVDLGQAVSKTGASFEAATPAMRAWSIATNEQRAALQALIAADNAGGFKNLVANILAGTVAHKGAAAAADEHGSSMSKLGREMGYVAQDVADFIPGAQGLGRELQYLGRDFSGLGAEIGLVNTVIVATGIGALLAFAAAMSAVITKGVELQKTLQDVKEGVAGVLTTDSTKFTPKEAQLGAEGAYTQIIEEARKAQVPISDLSKTFMEVEPAATRANASIDKQVKLISELIAQEGALHIPHQRLITDLEQIFNGQTRNTNQLAQRLGLDKAQVLQLRETGQLTDELIQKVEAYAKAHETGADTIDRAQQKVKAAFEQLAIAATKPIVEPLTKALNALSDTMNTVDAKNVISQIESIISAAARGIGVLQDFGRAIVAALQSAQSFADKIVRGTLTGGVSAVTEGATSGGFAPPSSDLSEAEALALSNRLAGQEKLRHDVAAAADVELPGLTVTGRDPGVRPPPAGYPAGPKGRHPKGRAGPSQDTLDQQEISKIQSEINEKEQAYHALIEKSNAAHQLGKQTLGEMQATNLKAGQEFIDTINKETAKLEEMKAKVEAVGTAQGGLNDKEQTQVNKLQAAIDKLDILKSKTQIADQKDTWLGQWTSGLQKFGEELSFTGDKAVATFKSITNQGIDATANALTGLISGTKNWQQSFIQAGESILNMMIKVALQALVGLALQQSTSQSARFDDARTAAANVYASVSSIYGIGWILAPIAAAAAFAAVLAFAEGGIVPGAPSATDNRMAMVATGEGIVTARAVQHYGPDMIHAMNSMTFSPSFASGGVVGSGATPGTSSKGSQQPLNFAFFDDRAALAKWLRSTDGRKIVVDHVMSAVHEIGIPATIG